MPLNTLPHTPVEETIHGITVDDPYRWLEDRSLPETEGWIKEQRERCDRYFVNFHDLAMIQSRVRTLLDVDIVDQPRKVAGRYFYRRRDQGKEQGCIYVRDAAGNERVLVDPAERGLFSSVGIHSISSDASLLAYELRFGGEDKKSIHLVDVGSGYALPDKIESGYARGFAFTSDCNGFFYCQEVSEETKDHTINLHLFNESVADRVVFRVARTRGSRLVLTADHVHLGAIWIRQQGGDLVEDFWMAKRSLPEIWRSVFTNKKPPFHPLLTHGRIFAISYQEAPNGKLVELNEDGVECRTIIPEQSSTIKQVRVAGDKIFASYLNNLAPCIRCWNFDGHEQEGIDVPVDGTLQLLPNHNEEESVFYSYESFTQPPTIFEYLPNSFGSVVWSRTQSPLEQKSITITGATYPSRDGTRIPITLIGGTDTKSINPAPVIMTSYGGFGVTVTPQFSVLVSIMLEHGVIFALPHVRGGGEFGKTWHEAGSRRNRQVSFDDFLAAAEWLYSEKIATKNKIAIFGGSNSGLLVGVAMTQRPDYFCGVLCIAPLLDMLRYEYFDQANKWRHEYGTVEDADDFSSLYAYSPYHHIEDDVDYPATLFVAGDRDDRCNPAHVRKMAARLLDRTAQANPIVVDYSDQRGHSPALPISVRVEALARRIAFLCCELNLETHEGGPHENACA